MFYKEVYIERVCKQKKKQALAVNIQFVGQWQAEENLCPLVYVASLISNRLWLKVMACGSASESDVNLVTTPTISVCKWDLLEFVCDSFVSHFDWLTFILHCSLVVFLS